MISEVDCQDKGSSEVRGLKVHHRDLDTVKQRHRFKFMSVTADEPCNNLAASTCHHLFCPVPELKYPRDERVDALLSTDA